MEKHRCQEVIAIIQVSDTGDDGDLDGDRIEGSEILCIERGEILYTDIHTHMYI